MSGAICYDFVNRYPVHRRRTSYRVLLLCCRLIFQVYDVKVVHFKTSLEYRRVEIFHFAVCNQGNDVSPLCTNSKSYAAAPVLSPYLAGHSQGMVTEIYIEALLVDENLADQV